MEVGQWLRKLGLEQYEPAFRENRIDADVLGKLTSEDLKDLGVILVGDRRKLLDAIAQLREQAGTTLSSTPTTPPQESGPRPRTSEAEKRQVTVLFCDLVGSTALAARLDPEDLREVIGNYHRCCAHEITRFGGFVAKYLGDGVLAYFGYPQAHEDDADQAVRAGISLIQTVPASYMGFKGVLEVRIGIATGLVVVGDLLGEGSAQEQSVIGETPNLAARLQGIAEAGQVVIGASTQRLCGGLFEYRDLGPVVLKGFEQPVRAWQVIKEATGASRFEALHGSHMASLTGRDEELDLLHRRWREALRGEGRVAVITGEAGIGKSRLTVALDQMIVAEPHAVVWCFCSPHRTDSALYPIIRQLERAANFESTDLPSQKMAKLQGLMAQSQENLANGLPFLSDLLSLPVQSDSNFFDLSPQRRKQETLALLLRHFESMAQQQPLLMIFEDAHWIDPTTLELLTHLVERAPNHQLLLVITARPDFSSPWPAHSHVISLSLRRLAPQDASSVIAQLTNGKRLPEQVLDQILTRTDGVPLFIEELTQSVLESGFLREVTDGYVIERTLRSFDIPTTLQDSLMARLDRLASAKEMAQLGASIGREFPIHLLISVLDVEISRVAGPLGQLVDAGILFSRGTGADAVYTFKHALIRDAAYNSMLRARRQNCHQRIAAALEDQSKRGGTSLSPEVLAHHFQEAGDVNTASRYWTKAGDMAEQRGMGREAVAHYRAAVELLDSPSSTDAVRSEAPGLLMKLGSALQQVEGYGSSAALDAYRRARTLAEQYGQPDNVVRAGIGGAPLLFGDCRYREALRILGEPSAEHLAMLRPQLCVQYLVMQSVANFCIGRFQAGWDQAIQACSLDAEDPCTHANPVGGGDPAIVARGYASSSGMVLGHFDHCLDLTEKGLAIARDRRHAFSIAWALMVLARVNYGIGAYDRGLACTDEAAVICERHGFEARLGTVLFQRGMALFGLGRIDQALTTVARGLDLWRNTSRRFHMTSYLCEFTDGLIRCGRIDFAEGALAEAEQIAAETDEESHIAELYRLRGLLHGLADDMQTATAHFKKAIEWSRARHARLFELRAARDLAQSALGAGMPSAAMEELRSVVEWFPSDLESRDLKEARELLELAA
jgi:class 3 adenylate cyclase/tetratricopeptide (TPR) repeat protein